MVILQMTENQKYNCLQQIFLEKKNAEKAYFSCVLSNKVVILTTFNAHNMHQTK